MGLECSGVFCIVATSGLCVYLGNDDKLTSLLCTFGEAWESLYVFGSWCLHIKSFWESNYVYVCMLWVVAMSFSVIDVTFL